MINSVQNIKTFEPTPFNDFSKNGDYYLTRKVAKDIYRAKDKDSEQKGKKIGLIVALSSVVATLGVFLVTRGLPKNTYKYLTNWVQKLEENVGRRKQNGQSGPVTSFMKFSLKKMSSWAEKSKSLNNYNNYKDLLFKKMMSKTKFTMKIHDRITHFFENLTMKTVNKSYKKADSRFSRLFNIFTETNQRIGQEQAGREVTINGVTKKVSEWLSDAAKRQTKIQNELQAGFGENSRAYRLKKMKTEHIGLDEKVWKETFNGVEDAHDMKQKILKLKDSPMHQSFIAEDILAQNKQEIINQVSRSRRAITHDIFDTHRSSENILDNIQLLISPKDAESSKLIKTLRSKLSTYKKLSGSHEQQYRKILNDEIINIMNTLTSRIKDSSEIFGYSNKTIENVIDFQDELKGILTKSEKGELQEILTIYKALLPREEYLKLRGSASKAVNSLDKAINTETDLFFDKLRDLALGSAPTDVLSILGSVGGVAAGLSLADNKDERMSALLKYGIPIVGSLGTTLVLNIGLISGIKAMLIGTGSGAIINRIGTAVDNKRKEYNKEVEDKKHAEAIKAEINNQQQESQSA